MKSILPSLVLIVTALRPCSTFTTPTAPQTKRGLTKFASYYNSRSDDYYDEEYYPRRRGLDNYYDRQGSSESFRRSSNGRYYNRDDRRSYDSYYGGSDLAFGGQRRYGDLGDMARYSDYNNGYSTRDFRYGSYGSRRGGADYRTGGELDLYRGGRGRGRDISVYPSDSSGRRRRGYGYSNWDTAYDIYDVDPYYDADLYYDRNYVRDRDYDYSYDRRGRYDDRRDGMYGRYGDRGGRRRYSGDRYYDSYRSYYPDDSDRYMSRRSYRDGYMDRDYGNYRSRNSAWDNFRNVFR